MSAAEIASNGLGGGPWSDPATWRGNAVPKPEDEVTIRKGDAVVFDRDDDGKTTCGKLFIDPQGSLQFKKGAGKIVFVCSGPIESYGLMKLDGSASADDHHELRLTGANVEERTFKIEKGGGLVLAGKANLPAEKRNVRVASLPPKPKEPPTTAPEPWAKINALAGAALDLRLAEFADVQVHGTEIDNTGSQPNERLNILHCRFLGRCNVYLTSCDTPVLADNLLHYPGDPWHQPAAIYLSGCPLAEVKNNTIKGMYYYALSIYACTDAVVTGNSTEKCYIGAYCVGTAMFKANTFREAGSGFVVTSMAGTMEDCVFEKVGAGIHLASARVQMTNCIYRDPPSKDGRAIDYSAGEITLVNCNFGPESVTFPKQLAKHDKPLITAMHYLILGIKGEVEEDTLVDIQTVNPNPPIAPGALDPNLRNVPAPLVNKLTPLPQSLSPVMVKAWSIDPTGKTIPAPEYRVRVLGPTDGVKERKVLKTLVLKPDETWHRPRPNDSKPTVEVTIP